MYIGGMYKKGFVPGDIVYWLYHGDEGTPVEMNIEKVISIKMAAYLYRVKFKGSEGKPCQVQSILKESAHHKPIFFVDEDNMPGWMGEDEVFKFDKTAQVLYGTKETINRAGRLAGKR